MEIGKEIKQTRFRNEYQKVSVNLIFSSNWILEKFRMVLDKEDITLQQYNIIRILRGSSSPLSTQKIRERMIDKMSDTSRIVERLVKKGLTNKKTCPTDKRLVDVTLTGKGFELLDKLDAKKEEFDKIPSALTIDEAKTLNKLLDKLRQND